MLTFSGKIFYYLNGKIYSYKYNKAATDFVQGTAPVKIHVDPDENVYITCRGVLKIDSTGKSLKVGTLDTHSYCTAIIHEVSDSCVLTSLDGLSKDQSAETVLYSRNGYVDSIYSRAFTYSRINAVRINKNELIFSIGSDFYLYRNDTIFHLLQGVFSEIYFLTKDKSNRIYACTDNGLYVYNDIVLSDVYTVYLNGKVVTGCCEDNENGFWMATRDYGLYYLPNFSVKHLDVNTNQPAKPMCLVNNMKNTVYAGYWNGVVTEINNSIEKVVYRSPPSKKIYNLFLANNNKLFIAADESGFISENKFHPIVFKAINQKVGAHIKNNFLKRSDGSLYNSAQSNLLKMDDDEILETVDCKNRINCLFETHQHQLVLGCKNGAFLFNDSTKKTTPFHHSLEKISIEDIKYFHHQLCFATKGNGLVLIDGINSHSIRESDGLLSDLINRIYVHENDIWCATNKGISHIRFTDVDKFKYQILNITSKEGLPSNEINDITLLNDTLWVATNSGICFFNSTNDFTNTIAPIVYITSMRINGVDSLLQSHYSLPYDLNNLKISFEGISYKSQMDILYRYELITSKDSISGFTKNRDVDFLSLSPGNYSFSIRAKNSSGIWSKNTAAISFTINPPFWQTWWLRLIALVVMAASVYTFYKIRLKRIKEKFSIEKKQASLQLTAMRSQMNPHFIFNVMGSIRSYMQKNDMASAEKYLTSFAKLVRYTLDNSEILEVSLEEELNALRNYASLEMQRFENSFDFEIKCEEGIDMNDTFLPSLLLQPFVENAIKHGMERLYGRGKLLIEIKKIKDSIMIAIQDNGVGRNDAMHWNETTREKHVSHGSKLTFDRVTAFNKAYNKNITMQVIDLADKGAKHHGTRVEIIL